MGIRNNRRKYNAWQRARRKRLKKENPESLKAQAKRNYTKTSGKPGFKASRRNQALLRKYGITAAEYGVLLQAQNGHCALCPRTPESTKYGVLVVDHDHKTGRVRGLLCDPCNHALGILGDDEAGLIRALDHVRG